MDVEEKNNKLFCQKTFIVGEGALLNTLKKIGNFFFLIFMYN